MGKLYSLHTGKEVRTRQADARDLLAWMGDPENVGRMQALIDYAECISPYEPSENAPSVEAVQGHMRRLAAVVDVLETAFCLEKDQIPEEVMLTPHHRHYEVDEQGTVEIGFERLLSDPPQFRTHRNFWHAMPELGTRAYFHASDYPVLEFVLALHKHAASRGYDANEASLFVAEVVGKFDIKGKIPSGHEIEGEDFAAWLLFEQTRELMAFVTAASPGTSSQGETKHG